MTKKISIIKRFENFLKNFDVNKRARKGQIAALFAYALNKRNKFLFEMCCGAGKSYIAAFLIYETIKQAEASDKYAKIMFGSHRLLLNEQLFNELYGLLKANGIENIDWYTLSSGKLGNDDIQVERFTKESVSNFGEYNHSIVIACATSEKLHFSKDITEDNCSEIVIEIAENCEDKFFDLIVQDEAHKDITKKLFTRFETMANEFIAFSATPNKVMETFFDKNTFKYSFADALANGEVVKANLMCTAKVNSKQNKKKEYSRVVSCYEHLKVWAKKKKLNPVYLNYFSSVDRLKDYSDSLINDYGNTINVAVFASDKIVEQYNNKKSKSGKGIEITCTWNGEKTDKKELLLLCKNSKKPLIILSAFMIVEGIDIPAINGVGIWCDKNDANMFQAACRGCRVDNKNKDSYMIYTSEELVAESEYFLTTLYSGLDEMLEFGDGQEDCKGTGKSGKLPGDNFLKLVNPKLIKAVTVKLKNIQLNIKKEKEEALINDTLTDCINQILSIKNRQKQFDMFVKLCYESNLDGNIAAKLSNWYTEQF